MDSEEVSGGVTPIAIPLFSLQAQRMLVDIVIKKKTLKKHQVFITLFMVQDVRNNWAIFQQTS